MISDATKTIVIILASHEQFKYLGYIRILFTKSHDRKLLQTSIKSDCE